MKLHELKVGDEFTFVHLELSGSSGCFTSKFPPTVIGKRFRVERSKSSRVWITGLDPEVAHYTVEMCFRDYEVRLMALLAPATPQTSFTIPADLGRIEFLRDHPAILKRMQELSKDRSLEPYIKCATADDSLGGMDWSRTPEGGKFWVKVLSAENPEHFYTLYPGTQPTASIMSSKPSYKNGTEQKVPRPAPAIRTGKRVGGSAVSGKRSRSATVRGYLSHRAVIGY